MSHCTKWSLNDLAAAVEDIREKKLSVRTAAAAHGIPKSTLFDYASGKVEIGSKRGPDTILTAAEEQMLVNYVIHMAEIGYGRTREHLCNTVKEILEKDGRPNPFKNNRPGRKWWSLFMKRHPIALHSPEHLQLCRVRCCTPEALDEWYTGFDQFLQTYELKDQPNHIWNADESGFPLCPKTGKVIAIRNARSVYGITSDTKEQVTTLCAANAAGDTVPPMHIFSGERFKSNPMEDRCVDKAYFGRSPKGWISTELFYGWLANHFAKRVTERPNVLLVDGHSSHIDVEVSKFCKDQQIHLYCLPPHTSHVTQPLDVGFYGALKTSWGKACEKYKLANPGIPLTKYTFARVFKDAWVDCVKMSTFVNAFRQSGICPLNRHAIN